MIRNFVVILLETIKLALLNKQPLRFSSKDIYFKGNENVVYVIQNVKWWRREKQFSRHKTFVIWRSKDSLSLSDGKYQIALDFWCLKYPQIYFSVLLYFSDIARIGLIRLINIIHIRQCYYVYWVSLGTFPIYF